MMASATYCKHPKFGPEKTAVFSPEIWTMLFYPGVMRPKDADRMANIVDTDQTAPLIWDYAVCQNLSFKKLGSLHKCRYHAVLYTYEPQHDKTNKMACSSSHEPSKDSDQPGHPPSLISPLSAWRNLGSLATPKVHSEDWCPGWSDSSLGAQVILLVLSCFGSYCFHFDPQIDLVLDLESVVQVGLCCKTDGGLTEEIYLEKPRKLPFNLNNYIGKESFGLTLEAIERAKNPEKVRLEVLGKELIGKYFDTILDNTQVAHKICAYFT